MPDIAAISPPSAQRQLHSSRLHRLSLFTGLLAGLLIGSQALAAPQATSASPSQLQRGKAASLSIKTRGWQPPAQLALVPGGPYSSHQLDLPHTPRAIASDGRLAYVASRDGWLQSIEFPPQAAARISAQLKIGSDEIRQLKTAHGQLLAAIDGTGVMLFDVRLPSEIAHRWTYRTHAPVRDMQLGRGEAWLLLDDKRIEHLRFDEFSPSRAIANWNLPTAAHSFTVQNNLALIAGPDGLTSLDLSGDTAKILDQQTTRGSAQGVQFAAGLALLNDGPGGLVVFDAADPQQLRWLGSHAKRGPIDALTVSADRAWVGVGGQSILSIALGNPELPAAGDALRLHAPLVGMVSRGDTVFAATTRGVQRLDFSTPAIADISPEGVNLGGSRRGVVRDDILYVADWFSGLHLYDIRDPANPRHLGNYHTPGSSKGVTLYGDYALVGDDDRGLQIIDISNPRQPSWVSELNWTSNHSTLGLAYTMKRVGSTLYLADHRGGFQVIDLSDIKQPRILGALDTPGKSWAIDVSGHTAFVADDDDGLLIVDVSDPASIGLVGQFNPGGHAEDVVVRNGLAYLTFFDNGLFIVDVSDPATPRQLAHLDIPGNARGIQLVGDLAYISGWESGLQVVDISAPDSPLIIGSFDTDGAAWGTTVHGDTAYVLDWWGGIKVLDIRTPTQPQLITRYQARGSLQQLRRAGNYIFAASGAGGLQVFDSKNSLNPIWATGADLSGEALDLWLEDSHAYVASGDAGIAVFDILDPFYTRQVGQLATAGRAQLIRARDDYLFIADQRAGLLVADAREPQHPRLLSSQPMSISDLWVDDDGLLVASSTGLQRFRVDAAGQLHAHAHYSPGNAPDNTRSKAPAQHPVRIEKVRSEDGLLAISLSDQRVQLLRESTAGFALLGTFLPQQPIVDLQLRGHRLFVLGTQSGLMDIDITRPESPRLSILYPATAHHRSLLLTDDAAFIAGERRMDSVSLLPAVRITHTAGKPSGLQLPADLPSGQYHLVAIDTDGQQRTLPNAFTLRFTAPGKKNFNLDAMRKLMKQPLKPPAE